MLGELGIRTIDDRSDEWTGFPVVLPLPDGQSLCLDLPQPAILANLDPESVGFAVLDHLGYTRKAWGIARHLPYFDKRHSALESDLASLIEGAFREIPGALYLEGYRFYASGISLGSSFDVVILVTDAQDERRARDRASRSERSANALKKIGKALTMNQTLQPLCVAAVHEIASTLELAAVLLWARASDDESLELLASVGANRQGTSLIQRLDPERGVTCVAELAASTRQPFFARSVYENLMTVELEAKLCYLKPGSVEVLPLTVGDKLIGILELVGRDADPAFAEHRELMKTVAEHLSLALYSAVLFENAERLATYDPLTGIANHRAMQDFLHRRFSEAERKRENLGVIMLDVDHFRSFNEEEGHDAGDEVLRKVVEVLRSTVRPYDLPARYGGEEFTVILPGVGAEETLAIAERIRGKIERLEYLTRSGRRRHITASLGCAVFPETSGEPNGLLKAADVALFQAKRAGRNRAVMFEGRYKEDRQPTGLDFGRLTGHLSPTERDAGWNLADRSAPYLEHLSRELALSRAQEQMLQALLLLTPMVRNGRIGDLEDEPEFRLLEPSLAAIEERFDGKGPEGLAGPMIPLLARILAVVLAIVEERGTPLFEDAPRFDPDLLHLIGSMDEAA